MTPGRRPQPAGEPSPGELAKASDPGRYYAVTPGGDLESLRSDLHHLLNPFIGILRWEAQRAAGVDPTTVPYAANTGPQPLVEQAEAMEVGVRIPFRTIVGLVHGLQVATELADFALGEQPHAAVLEAVTEAVDRIRSPWQPAQEGNHPHGFEPSHTGMVCEAMFLDHDGHGAVCGLAPGHPVHHPEEKPR